MRIISGVINTRFTHRTKERSLRRTPMQIRAVALAVCALAFGVVAFAAGAPLPDVSAALAAAVADSTRPDSDTTRDADRKPEQTLAFSGIKPGDKVADYVADSGYFTRLFSSVVGSKGHVYAVEPTAFFKYQSNDMDSPCSYGIGCARLRVCGTQSRSRRSSDEDYTSWVGYRQAGIPGARGR
jgi:hypothetical protein